jgi:phosphate/sulfate permease
MSQSRKMSLVESIANIAIGYLVALTAQLIVFPLMGIPVSLSQNIVIGAIFTVVSLARSYVLRRVFNRLSSRYY